jgi:glycosyltransferase involved in cell wall biosynthesis
MNRAMGRMVTAVDLVATGSIAAALLPWLAVLTLFSPKAAAKGAKPRLLVVFVAHSYKSIKTYGHEQLIVQQGLGGFFEKVFTLYPFLGANPFDKIDRPDGTVHEYELDGGNIFLEIQQSFVRGLSRFPRANFIVSQWITLLRMKRFVAANSVSVIRGSDPFLTGLYAYLLSRITGRPFALRLGSNFDLLYENGEFAYRKIFGNYAVARAVARFVFSRCGLVCAATQNYLDYALANGCRPERGVVVRFGSVIDPLHRADPAARPAPRGFGSLTSRPFGVYVGRLTRIKQADHLVLVAAEARKRFPEAVIALIGDGDLAGAMKDEAARLGAADNLVFLGKQRQEAIASLLPRAAAYLAPHSGRSLAEAAFAGVPLVAYDWEWHGELVKSGVTGELVPFGDWRAMAQSFCRILSDPAYGRTLGENARAVALEMMDQEKIREIERARYQGILDGKGTRKGGVPHAV